MSSGASAVPADYFMRADGPLKPSDAVAALLVREDGRYVMQLRDAMPNIFYPDHWGCFGGAVDPGERPDAALRRELREELEFELPTAREFTRFDFDFRSVGHPKTSRIYYEVPVSDEYLVRAIGRARRSVVAMPIATIAAERVCQRSSTVSSSASTSMPAAPKTRVRAWTFTAVRGSRVRRGDRP